MVKDGKNMLDEDIINRKTESSKARKDYLKSLLNFDEMVR